jgi:hypothetical protein
MFHCGAAGVADLSEMPLAFTSGKPEPSPAVTLTSFRNQAEEGQAGHGQGKQEDYIPPPKKACEVQLQNYIKS